jgi:U3 small nucleolar RNA-associated protein 12
MLWDLKTGQKVLKLSEDNNKSEVSRLASNGRTGLIASGHSDGTIRIFDYNSSQLKVTFSGHKSVVTALCFDGNGLRLASGGKDTEIVIWDVTNESGLFRLKGHKGVVTQLQFMAQHNCILSSSKDTFIKFWDLNTQHCFKTLIGHKTEVSSFVLFNNDLRLISGANDSELRVWNIIFKDQNVEEYQRKLEDLKSKIEDKDEDEEEIDEQNDVLIVERFGSVLRKSTQRLTNLFIDSTERILICHAKESFIECFKLKTEEEVKKSIRNRLKKERKRRKSENIESEELDELLIVNKTLSDEIEKLDVIKTSSKVKSCDLLMNRNECKIAVLLSNNSIEFYSLKPSIKPQIYASIHLEGHRSDVRTVAISSDNLSILSASAESLKVWNRTSGKCITTIEEGVEYALCSVFAPGDRYCVLGTKTGKLQIFDLSSAQLQQTIDASEELLPIWSICLYPNLQGLVSGGEDKSVKFWNFELLFDNNTNSRQLTLKSERTLTMSEGVLCVKISPNSKFIAVSLLDSTVKVFFMDTLKFFLSLYGHKFPVLCMDISDDSNIIVTGSSDKNIKIWGLDFGDCHKSIFGHEDNIMCLQFVPKTHYFFTASKDKLLKEWDADNYQKIITLEGHQSEIWALAVSPNGKFVVTASHDKSIRIWDKSNEPLVLEEEQEIEREKQFEKSMFENEETVIPGETNKEATLPSKRTVETVKGAEKLIEALDVFEEEVAVNQEYETQCKRALNNNEELPAKPSHNPLMNIYSTCCPFRYILEVLKRIKSNELEETLLTLPFNYTISLLKVLTQLLERKWEIELLCRSICFIIR